MPIYDYQCNDCGKVEEYLLPIQHERPSCAYCDSSNTERLIAQQNFNIPSSKETRQKERRLIGIGIILPDRSPREN